MAAAVLLAVFVGTACPGGEVVRVFGIGEVTAISRSPNGAFLAVASASGFAKVYDGGTYDEVVTVLGHGGRVTDVRFDAAGQIVVTGSDDGTVRIWSVATGEELRRFDSPEGPVFPGGGGVTCVAISPDGSKVAAGLGRYPEPVVIVWETATGGVFRTLVSAGRPGNAGDIDFSPDGRFLLLGESEAVRLWDVEAGVEVREYVGEESGYAVDSVRFSPDGSTFACNGWPAIWDVETGVLLHEISVSGGVSGAHAVAYSEDGEAVVVGETLRFRVWDVESGENTGTFWRPGEIAAVAFSSDGKQVITGGPPELDRPACRVVDLETGGTAFEFLAGIPAFPRPQFGWLGGRRGIVSRGASSDDGLRFAQVVDFENGELMARFGGYSGGRISGVGASRNAAVPLIYAMNGSGSVEVWRGDTGAFVSSIEHGGFVSSGFEVSSDGWDLLGWGSTPDGATLIDVAEGSAVREFGHEGQWVSSAMFSPDGQLVATGGYSDGLAKVWSRGGGALLKTLEAAPHGEGLTYFSETWVRFSPSRLFGASPTEFYYPLLTATWAYSDNALTPGQGIYYRLWDTKRGELLREAVVPLDETVGLRGGVAFLDISPNGRVFAVGMGDGSVSLRTTGDLEEVDRLDWKTVEAGAAGAPAVLFSPDGRELAAFDGVGRVWDVEATVRGPAIQGRVVRVFSGGVAESPLEGIELVIEDAGGDAVRQLVTDRGGYYQAAGLSPGTYHVSARWLGVSSVPRVVELENEDVDVNFRFRYLPSSSFEGSRIRGALRGRAPSDSVQEHASFRLWQGDKPVPVRSPNTIIGTENGYQLRAGLVFENGTAEFTLEVLASGYEPYRVNLIAEVGVELLHDVDLVPLDESQLGVLRGLVVDAVTGHAIEATALLYHSLAGYSNVWGFAGEDGVFSIPGLSPDSYRLSVTAPGYYPSGFRTIPIGVGGVEELTIALWPDVNGWPPEAKLAVQDGDVGGGDGERLVIVSWPVGWEDVVVERSTGGGEWESIPAERGNAMAFPGDGGARFRVRYADRTDVWVEE